MPNIPKGPANVGRIFVGRHKSCIVTFSLPSRHNSYHTQGISLFRLKTRYPNSSSTPYPRDTPRRSPARSSFAAADKPPLAAGDTLVVDMARRVRRRSILLAAVAGSVAAGAVAGRSPFAVRAGSMRLRCRPVLLRGRCCIVVVGARLGGRMVGGRWGRRCRLGVRRVCKTFCFFLEG